MTVRDVTESDMPLMREWWDKHAWPVTPEHLLPDTGYMIDGLCATWLYVTNSRVSWVAWTVSNPDAGRKELNVALDLLIEETKIRSVEQGCDLLCLNSGHKGLIKRCKRLGFTTFEENMTNLMCNGGK